jgi:putative DNA primase/helicase
MTVDVREHQRIINVVGPAGLTLRRDYNTLADTETIDPVDVPQCLSQSNVSKRRHPPDPKNSTAAQAGHRDGGNKTKEAGQLRNSEYHKSPGEQTLSDLEAHPLWVAWKEVDRDGKPAKVPFDPSTGGKARSDNRTTWASRASAAKRAAHLLKNGGKGGVGIMLGPIEHDSEWSLGGIDLDSSRDPTTGILHPWASDVVELIESYVEISPSNEGVKIFFRYRTSDLPRIREMMQTDHGKSWSRGSHCEIALHVTNRYFTVTDRSLHPDDIADLLGGGQNELATIKLAKLRTLIKDIGPSFAGKSEKPARDESGSGYGYRFFLDQAGAGVTFKAAFAALDAEDGQAGEWSRRATEREIKRTWDNACKVAIAKQAEIVGKFSNLDDIDDLLGSDDGPVGKLKGFALNEDGVALAFTKRHRDQLRFCHSTGRWFEWTGTHWRREETQLAFTWARDACRDMASSHPKNAQAKALSRAASASAVERYARADRAFAVTMERWDPDPWLLGTPGGTVDLRTGKLRPGRQDDFITKLTAVAPIPLDDFDADRDCPRWLEFLDQVTEGNSEAIQFLQSWFGYSLTGDTREEALLFVHGPGGSGKSTAVNAIGDLLGDYCVNIATETLSASKFDRHPTEIARLRGARMARASETEQGRTWAQQRITALTGGDTITARYMRQDDFEFRPVFKLTIVGNHRPSIQNVDAAIRRRFNVMPFDHLPERADHTLKGALRTEWAGILSWAIVGCLNWQRDGMVRPEIVRDTTNSYFEEQDTFQLWIDDCCETGKAFADTTENLWQSWEWFARRSGDDPGSRNKTFPEMMQSRGYVAIRNSNRIQGRGFKGIKARERLDFDEL